MEEILASIRRIISDDEARGATRPASNPEASRPMSNVSHLFAEPLTSRPHNVVELPIDNTDEREPSRITEAFAQAMAAETEPEPDYAPPRPRIAAPPLPDPAGDRRTTPLLSPRTDAAVNAAFAQLTDTLFNGKTRTIDGVVEDMLRPMLKTWLDNNLPPMVERMVREEIERVSRGRR